MTIDLTFLVLTALLASSMWIPYIIGVNTIPFAGEEEAFVRPPDQRNMVPWVHRAHRAHLNLLEQFLPYAVIVLIGHSLGVANGVTAWCAGLFFVLRIVHAIGMITAWTRFPVRPTIFTACWVITLVHAWQVFTA